MTRLRFIKNWSTYRPGDYMETESPFTVERMVRTYGLAEVVDDGGAVVPLPPIEPEDKAVEEPAKDKMVRRARKKKGNANVG